MPAVGPTTLAAVQIDAAIIDRQSSSSSRYSRPSSSDQVRGTRYPSVQCVRLIWIYDFQSRSCPLVRGENNTRAGRRLWCANVASTTCITRMQNEYGVYQKCGYSIELVKKNTRRNTRSNDLHGRHRRQYRPSSDQVVQHGRLEFLARRRFAAFSHQDLRYGNKSHGGADVPLPPPSETGHRWRSEGMAKCKIGL